MAYQILKSSTECPLLFFMVQSSDHLTGLTGASPTVTISKNGAAFGAPAGAVTEIANGWYKVAANATDTNTNGPIALHATASGGDPFDGIVAEVVAYDPQDAVRGGMTAIPNAAPGANGGLPTVDSTGGVKLSVGTGSNQIALSAGAVPIQGDLTAAMKASVTAAVPSVAAIQSGLATPTNITAGTITTVTNLTNAPANGDFTTAMKTSLNAATPSVAVAAKKATALARFAFLMTDSAAHAPATGKTVTCTRSIDGGAFAAGTLANVGELGSGVYLVDFGAADLNGGVVTLQATAPGCDAAFVTIITAQ